MSGSLRCAIVAVFVVGFRQRNPGAVVNAVFAYLGTYVPAVVERTSAIEFRPWQRLYVATAMLLHAIGMLGPYDDIRWWDHVTHTMSASIVGGATFVAAKRRGKDPIPLTLGSVVTLGALWELIEYLIHATATRLGVDPILVFYNRKDTVLDLVFNLLGAFLVILFGDRKLANLFESDG
ncbi:hypothetical protein [Halomicroarcula nitratireducens]|uniref:DUF2238 domain-containing protein n=1 Tax=Haloarcula nitratireducens TaxID=2487749 RepID=A0AAW4PJM8_9EURY|nr:hypothetical protein [Halomicroarcula nitratireducens]